MCTLTPLIIRSSPHRAWATWKRSEEEEVTPTVFCFKYFYITHLTSCLYQSGLSNFVSFFLYKDTVCVLFHLLDLNSYLVISKCDECKCPERLGDEDISDFAILHKVLPQVISCHILCTAANKDFTAAHGLVRTHLWGQRRHQSLWVTFIKTLRG